MKQASNILLSEMTQLTQDNIKFAESLKLKSETELNRKKDSKSWSALECLEHLNLYGDFYLPEIEKRMSVGKFAPDEIFNSGWLGNYFANSMKPSDNMTKMNTFKDKNPANSALTVSVIDRFLHQQHQLLELLKKAEKHSLNKIKCSITLSPFIRLKLGDVFRFLIYHNHRHVVQANKALS
jgi:hypothetical protein